MSKKVEEQEEKEIIWFTSSQVLDYETYRSWQKAVRLQGKKIKYALKEALELWIKEYAQK